MIRVKEVSLTIKEQLILDNISMEAQAGEAVGLIGGNGSGKTMLMKCICGFNTVYTGEIKVNGKIVREDVEFPENTSFIIETPGFIPYIDVLTIIAIHNI